MFGKEGWKAWPYRAFSVLPKGFSKEAISPVKTTQVPHGVVESPIQARQLLQQMAVD